VSRQPIGVVGNFSPAPRRYRVGLPQGGTWKELINTDLEIYAGSGRANGVMHAEATPWQHQPYSVEIDLPPLGVLWLQRA
jgi:1,4-alpha-glucan branching enzyme